MNSILNIFRFLVSFYRIGFTMESIDELRSTLNRKPTTFFLFVLCTLYSVLSFSQNFPVQVIPQVTPPAPIYISNYADASAVNSPLRVQLILNDFDIANREIRIKTYFEGSGLSFQSNDIVVGASPLFLEGGIPLVLTNVDLAPYFRFENITGINGNQYGNAIPEGAYQFCVEVYDVLTGSRLSNRSCALSVVFQNEPPFLVMPRNKTNVEEINPQYIVFQWTPRSINVTNVEYELSLVEIWDNQVDPQQAFLSSPPVFQTTTSATTYVYGPTEPLLLSGKNYAWRVQAKAKQGLEEIGLFKNQGFSEIYSFSYAGSCDLPLSINHEVKGSTNANIFWDDFSTDIPEYTVRYRQKNIEGAEWFLAKTTTNEVTLWNLKAGTTYEYQLRKNCGITQSDWSFTKVFTTALEFEEESLLDCGVSPDINLTNMEPLASIGAGAVFKAGDFPVKITEVSGANGRFTGKGYVTLPYLKNIKVAVEFTNILINTDQEMAEGSVRTAYDASWGNILDTGDVADQLDDLGDVFTGGDNINYRVDFKIDSVDNIEIIDDKISITGPNGETKTLDHDKGDTYQIKDASGNTFNIDAEGTITKGAEAAEGGEATAQNTEGISGGNGTAETPSVNEITASGVTITFKKSSTTKYDLDIADNDFEKSTYPKAKDANGSVYYPIHKAVVSGETDEFIADIDISNENIAIGDLIFKTVSGNALETRIEGTNQVIITLTGVNSYRSEEALVTYLDEDDTYKIAASFFIHHIKKQDPVDVVIVSVNGTAQLNNIEQELNSIYGKAGAQFRVNTASLNLIPSDWDDNKNVKLDYDGSGLLSDYPQELKNIQQKYKSDNPNWNAKAYHLFLLPTDMALTKPLSGFMPKTRQWGYIFNAHQNDALENKPSQNLVAAHELGHGVFKLPHPFQNDENKSGSNTSWLMDYNNGYQLPYMHWAAMSDESLQLFLFQDEEDSEFAGSYMITPDLKLSFIQNTSTLYTDSDLSEIPAGTLPGFTLLKNGIQINYRWKDGKYRNKLNDSDIYPHTTIDALSEEKKINLFYNSEAECGLKRYIPLVYSQVQEYGLTAIGILNTLNKFKLSSKVIKCAVQLEESNEWAELSKTIDCNSPSIENTLAKNLSAVNSITSKTSVSDANRILQENYSACLFENLDFEQRVLLLDIFLKDDSDIDDSDWEFSSGILSTGDTFFIPSLFLTVSAYDRVRLLKEGVMKNNYEWLRSLYSKSTGIVGDDINFIDVFPIFMNIGNWANNNLQAFANDDILTEITKVKFDDIEGFSSFTYSPGLQPFILGSPDSQTVLNSGNQTETIILRASADLLDNGRIGLFNGYLVKDKRVIISTPGNANRRDGYFNYSQSYTPFEPIVIIAGKADNPFGLQAGQEVIVPAIVALSYQQLIRDKKTEEDLRVFGNILMISSGIVAAPFSGGTSLVAVASTIAAGGAVVGSIDLVIQGNENIDKNSELYMAWDNFYTVYGIMDAGVGLASGGIGAYNALRSVNLVKSYNRFNTAYQAAKVDAKAVLKRDFDMLKNLLKTGVIEYSDDMPISFFENVNDLGSTYDQYQKLSSTIRGEIYNFYKQKKWKEIEEIFRANKLNGGWPPSNGGYNIIDDVELKAGMKFDRYQDWFKLDANGNPTFGGSFTSPIYFDKYNYAQRALKVAENENALYYEILILKDLPIKGQLADVIPWFGKSGNGKQMMFKFQPKGGELSSFKDLIDKGYIRITIKSSPNRKFSVWKGKSF